MCDKCLESPEYDLDYDGGDFLCPKCGYKWYIGKPVKLILKPTKS